MVWIHFGFPAMNVLLQALLLLCIARLWLMPLPSSFWVDEMVTAYVVRFGPTHLSLAVAPQVPASIYYVLPRAAGALFGFSEIAYRLPSVLAMAIALFLIARLAARLICPEAAWFAVFACLALRGINYQAADARPYALGTCVAAASLLFLVRWLDSGGWDEALLFAVFAALVWRGHLIFWPLYLLFAVYALVRLVRGDTRAGWLRAGVVFLLVGLALAPVLRDALPLFREAKAHVIVPPPSALDLVYSLKIGLIAVCCAGACVLRRVFWCATDRPAVPGGQSARDCSSSVGAGPRLFAQDRADCSLRRRGMGLEPRVPVRDGSAGGFLGIADSDPRMVALPSAVSFWVFLAGR